MTTPVEREEPHVWTAALYALIQTSFSDVRTHSLAILDLQRRLDEIQRQQSDTVKEIGTITRILRGSNGSDSLFVKIALLEQALSSTTSSLLELRKALEARQAEDQKGKWQLAGVIAAGLLALVSAVFTALLAIRR
jgi:hypothetical protein